MTNYLRQVESDPRWWQWLQGIDPPTGRVRGQLLDDALERGNHAHAATFVEQFQHARATGTLALGARRSAMPSSSRQFFTREQIRQNYERHRKGQITGAEWNQLEHNMIAAAREGRVANAVPLAKNFADGR